MKVRVQMFAVARELTGQSVVEIELGERACLSDLRAALQRKYPSLGSWLPRIAFAVGAEYADDAAQLAEGMEVACIPPVSGG